MSIQRKKSVVPPVQGIRSRSSGMFHGWTRIAACLLLISGGLRAHQELADQIALVTREIASEAGNIDLYLRRAELHREGENWMAALSDYERCRELDPEAAIDFYEGRMWVEAGDGQRAIPKLEAFLEDHPDNGIAMLEVARAFRMVGDEWTAKRRYRLAVGALINPRPGFYLEWTDCILAIGDRDAQSEALAVLDSGIARLGPIVSLQLKAIALEINSGFFASAIERVDRLAAQSSRKDSWLVRKAEIQICSGDANAAGETLHSARERFNALPAPRKHTQVSREIRERIDELQAQVDDFRPGKEEDL